MLDLPLCNFPSPVMCGALVAVRMNRQCPHHLWCWASPSLALPLAQLSYSCSAPGQYKYSWAAFIHTQATSICLCFSWNSTISYIEIGEFRALWVLFVYSLHSESRSWLSQLQAVSIPLPESMWNGMPEVSHSHTKLPNSPQCTVQSSTEITKLALALSRDNPAALDGLASVVPCSRWKHSPWISRACSEHCSAPQQSVLPAQAWQAPLVTLTSPAAEETGKISSEEPTVSFAKPSA